MENGKWKMEMGALVRYGRRFWRVLAITRKHEIGVDRPKAGSGEAVNLFLPTTFLLVVSHRRICCSFSYSMSMCRGDSSEEAMEASQDETLPLCRPCDVTVTVKFPVHRTPTRTHAEPASTFPSPLLCPPPSKLRNEYSLQHSYIKI